MSEADLTEKSLYSVDVTASERLRKRPRLTVDLKSKIRCSSEPPIATSTLQPVINSAILTTPRFEPLDQSGEDDIAVQTKAHPSAVELQTYGPKSPGRCQYVYFPSFVTDHNHGCRSPNTGPEKFRNTSVAQRYLNDWSGGCTLQYVFDVAEIRPPMCDTVLLRYLLLDVW